ncbi:MAG: hypothetical protein HFH68_16375 [Lachnospiraceae bacterium]|nr:hypothetical protein [Lachnospiraceae bacterium]
MNLKTGAEKQLIYADIYKNKEDRLIYCINKPDGSTLSSKELLNARGYKAVLYSSGYPEMQKVLVVSWDYDRHFVYFDYSDEYIKESFFLRKLNLHGLSLMVSGREQKNAASVLLAYSVKFAKEIEIPFNYGWWKDLEGRWHFAYDNCHTMKEVYSKIEH